MGSRQKILILSSNTGGGHQSAATALYDSFLRLSPPEQVWVNVAQVLEDAHVITRRFADLYNYLLKNHQHYMKYYYWAIERFRPYESHMLFELCRKYGQSLLYKVAPTMLVSVHPMTQHFFAYLLSRLGLQDKIPLYTVVTDPCKGFWQGWACSQVKQYFVAHSEARDQLTEFGVDPHRISVVGMPVHAKFKPLETYDQKQSLRAALGLHPDRFTILINAGWIGGGNVPSFYQPLIEQAPPNSQLIFLTGKNSQLYDMATQMAAKAQIPVKVIGFTASMDAWMNASDAMFSKLGGLTTFEALACELPILADCLTPPMPQEQGTAKLIQKTGAGILIESPTQLIQSIHQLAQSPTDFARIKQSSKLLGKPGAVDQMTQLMLDGLRASASL